MNGLDPMLTEVPPGKTFDQSLSQIPDGFFSERDRTETGLRIALDQRPTLGHQSGGLPAPRSCDYRLAKSTGFNDFCLFLVHRVKSVALLTIRKE